MCGTVSLKEQSLSVGVNITAFYNVQFMMLELMIKICILINTLL